jgi:Dynamin central region
VSICILILLFYLYIYAKFKLERLLGPSLECAQLVYEELKRMIYDLNVRELRKYDNLNCQINTILEKMLSSLMIPTCAMINNVFEVEQGHINTRHPDFILGAKDSLSEYKLLNETLQFLSNWKT